MSDSISGFDYFLTLVDNRIRSHCSYSYKYLTLHFQQLLPELEDYLQVCSRAENDILQKAYYVEAIEQLKMLGGDVSDQFCLSMMQAFWPMAHLQAGVLKTGRQDQRQDKPECMDDELYQLAQYYSQRSEDSLMGIHRFYVFLLHGVVIKKQNHPVSPLVIANAINNALWVCRFHDHVKRSIYSFLDEYFFQVLDNFYTDILETLEKMYGKGLPKKSTAKLNTGLNAGAAFDEGPLLADIETLETIDSDFNHLIEYAYIPADIEQSYGQSLHLKFYQQAEVAGVACADISREDIDKILVGLQGAYDPATDGDVIQLIEQELEWKKDADTFYTINEHDENIINLMTLIFKEISRHQTQDLAHLFMRLTLPFTRLVLMDELFLHDKSHEARVFLDKLLVLSHSSHKSRVLKNQIHYCVLKIVLKFRNKIAVFNQVTQKVQDMLKDNERAFEAHLKLTSARIQAEEQLHQAQDVVGQMLQYRLESVSRVLIFHRVLIQVWKTILCQIFLHEGRNSEQWKHACQLLNFSMRLSDRKISSMKREESKQLAQKFQLLQTFLQSYHYSVEHQKLFCTQLKSLYSLLLQGLKLEDIDEDALPGHEKMCLWLTQLHAKASEYDFSNPHSLIGAEHQGLKKRSSSHFLRSFRAVDKANAEQFVNDLKLGQWMMVIVNQQPLACMLVYQADKFDTYIFCDKQHKQTFRRHRSQLIEDIEKGFASPLLNQLSFQGNLSQVVARLQQQSHVWAMPEHKAGALLGPH
ncbi:MAG: DUF1631 family protein [Pseudomonadales bacterium]|nr:DUF1631 family protein [Pseudomonadales bacterium]